MNPNRLRQPTAGVCHPRAWALSALVAPALLGACASTPEAPPQLALAEAAVQRANTPGTAVDAPTELRIATDKLTAARAAVIAGDPDRARTLSEQAEIDARVAELRAEVVRLGKAARESEKATRAIAEEIQRKTGR